MGILRIRWGDLSLVGIGWAMAWFGLGGSCEVDHGVRRGDMGKSVETLTSILLLECVPGCWDGVMVGGLRRIEWGDFT